MCNLELQAQLQRHCFSSLFTCWLGFRFSQQLFQITSLQGHPPTVLPLPLQLTLSQALLSVHNPQFIRTCVCRMSLSSLQEEDVLCPPRCGYCCSHLYCHPLLLPPFLQAVGVPGSSILRKFSFNSLTHIQLLRCSIRPDVAELFFSFTCSLIFK